MEKGVTRAARKAVNNGEKIHFNLDGFRNKGDSFREAVRRGRNGTGTTTEAELYWMLREKSFRENTIFYRNGNVVEDPQRLFGDVWEIN